MVEVNKKAPDFKAKAIVEFEEKEISLSDFKGKKVALYFYPKDNTPGCTIQAENLRDFYNDLTDKNIIVIGVSKDSIESHKKFAIKKELPFALVSDEDLEINNSYGVWQMKKFMGKQFMGTVRTTFLIDEEGIIKDIISKPVVKNHANEVINAFN
jgi:peroxiredoxin Q/BCP